MYSEKLESLLVASLEATKEERLRADDLSAGVDEIRGRWEIIVKFYADSDEEFAQKIMRKYPGTEVALLLCNYCIMTVKEEDINKLANEPEIIYIEKSKILTYDLIYEKQASCLPVYADNAYTDLRDSDDINVKSKFNFMKYNESTQGESAQGESFRWESLRGESFRGESEYLLSGRGVIVAVIDTGINIFDRAFRNADGSTRIIRFCNQQNGRIYDSDDINDELSKADNPEIFGDNQHLFYDYANHGINVCKIACGNDGVAFDSSIIFVALKRSDYGYSNTTDMMQAIDYCIRTAATLNMPIAINISYGSNYGPHISDDIQTSYINDVSGVWKSIICVAAGNEADEAMHAEVRVNQSETVTAELFVGDYERNISFAAWINSLDEIDVTIVSPDGEIFEALENEGRLIYNESAKWDRKNAPAKNNIDMPGGETVNSKVERVYIYRGDAKPYSEMNEAYVCISAADKQTYITTGIWRIAFTGKSVKVGNVSIWLSSATVINEKTGFVAPASELTFTVPSTADKVMTVGSYDPESLSVSEFSGRGYAAAGFAAVKPDIVAPGERVAIDENTVVTGTSFAAPFVTGAAALLMEWGIVLGNDAYMYGDKLKATLKRSAVPLPGQREPSPSEGWGRLCLSNLL